MFQQRCVLSDTCWKNASTDSALDSARHALQVALRLLRADGVPGIRAARHADAAAVDAEIEVLDIAGRRRIDARDLAGARPERCVIPLPHGVTVGVRRIEFHGGIGAGAARGDARREDPGRWERARHRYEV